MQECCYYYKRSERTIVEVGHATIDETTDRTRSPGRGVEMLPCCICSHIAINSHLLRRDWSGGALLKLS